MARIKLDLPEEFLFETLVEVRVTDLNYGGHLGNDRVLALLHEARARFFAAHGMSELDVDGLGILVADAVVLYRAEAFFADPLRIRIAAADFNKYGCDLLYLATHAAEGREIARAKTGIVFFDYAARRLSSAPARFLDAVRVP